MMIHPTAQRREAGQRIIRQAYKMAAMLRDAEADLIIVAADPYAFGADEALTAEYIHDQLREATINTFALAGVVGELNVSPEMNHLENR
jgi:hypothetical protein